LGEKGKCAQKRTFRASGGKKPLKKLSHVIGPTAFSAFMAHRIFLAVHDVYRDPGRFMV